jgi:anaerobic ribonucleoside-triphosphate reductase activating protein
VIGPALDVAARVPDTEAEGPYLRYALWLQGCPLRCPGCCNPGMLPFGRGERVPVDALLAEIGAAPGIEGVTLLGGEPFAQAGPLSALGAGVRAAGLGLVAFGGFTVEELRSRGPEERALLSQLDLLVDGPYQAGRASTRRRFVGSDNQGVHFLTGRYRHLDDGAGGIGAGEGPGEIRIRADRIFVSGAPDAALVRALAAPGQPVAGGRSAPPPIDAHRARIRW